MNIIVFSFILWLAAKLFTDIGETTFGQVISIAFACYFFVQNAKRVLGADHIPFWSLIFAIFWFVYIIYKLEDIINFW